jgi:hypothetical protein
VPLGASLGSRGYFGLGHRSLAGGLGHRYQGFEEPRVIAVFRVPLHAEDEFVFRQLDRFDYLVIGPRHGQEPAADLLDRLVMGGGYVRGVTEHLPELARGADLQVVGGHLDRIRLMDLVAEAIGEVLGQGSAAGHVQDVHAAADRQKRKIGVDGRPRQDQLEPVPPVVGHIGLLVRRLVVQRGVDIAPAGQQQAVEPGNQHGYRTRGDGRQYHRGPSRTLDSSRIAHRRDNGLANPVAPASSFKLAGDADDRPAHPSSPHLRSECP